MNKQTKNKLYFGATGLIGIMIMLSVPILAQTTAERREAAYDSKVARDRERHRASHNHVVAVESARREAAYDSKVARDRERHRASRNHVVAVESARREAAYDSKVARDRENQKKPPRP